MKRLFPFVLALAAATVFVTGCSKPEEEEKGIVNSQQKLEPAPGQKTNPNLHTAPTGG